MPDIRKYPPRYHIDAAGRKKLAAYVKRYGLPEGVEHGAMGYRVWLCRDDECKAGFAVEQYNARQVRYQRTIDNGGIAPTKSHNKNTYRNWGCRCDPCTDDHNSSNREWYNGEAA